MPETIPRRGLARVAGETAGHILRELIVAVAVISVVVFLVIAHRSRLAHAERYDHALRALAGALQDARMQAVSQGLDVGVEFDDVLKEFVTETDLDQDGVISGNERVARKIAGIEDIHVAMPFNSGSFTSAGTFNYPDRDWKILVQSPSVGSTYIRVYSTGYTVVEDTQPPRDPRK